MTHFTYKEANETDKINLCQGDVLKITPELSEIIKECHPYFQKEQYRYFIILTQSCDLVKRDGKCKTSYITLSAVRSFNDFINKKAKEYNIIENKGFKLLEDAKFNTISQLVERIYNNNENEYFFLYKDLNLNFAEDMVAYLKVSFALKVELHYEKCLNAKIMELSDEFKAKLGWLVGEMFSRVGTVDWYKFQQRNELLKYICDDLKNRFIVSDKKRLTLINKAISNENNNIKSREDVNKYIKDLDIKSNYEEVTTILINIIKNFNRFKREEDKDLLITLIKSNESIKSYIKK